MKQGSVAVAFAALLAVWLAVPAQAAEWCLSDPAVKVQTAFGQSISVYVTEGVMGTQHAAALAASKITYTSTTRSPTNVLVVLNDYIPADASGTFATKMVVSSKPYSAGVLYGAASATSGSMMSVQFWINPQKPKA